MYEHGRTKPWGGGRSAKLASPDPSRAPKCQEPAQFQTGTIKSREIRWRRIKRNRIFVICLKKSNLFSEYKINNKFF